MESRNARFGLMMILLAGCAAKSDDAGFSSVQSLAHDRTGQSVRWNHNSDDAKAIDGEMQQLLSHELTSDAAVQIALLNNRSLQATYEDLGIAQADVEQAGLMKNPVLDAQIRFPDTPPKVSDLEFSLAADFLDALMIPARKKIAAAQFEATKARVGAAVLNLAADVRGQFYSCVGAEKMLELHRATLAAIEASAQAASQQRAAKNISEIDLLGSQAQLQQEQLSLAQAQADLDEGREKLAAMLGLDDVSTMNLAQELPDVPPSDPPVKSLEQTAVEQRMDLRVSKQQIEATARAGGLVRDTRYISEMEIGVDGERQTSGQWIVGPTISLPIPLFDQGQARVAKAQAQVKQAEQNYAALVTKARSEVRRSCTRLAVARNRALMYRDSILPLQSKIVQQSQLLYNGMLLGVFDLLKAKEAELDAQREYANATRDYWVEHAELGRAVGGRIPTASTRPATMPTSQPIHEHHHGD